MAVYLFGKKDMKLMIDEYKDYLKYKVIAIVRYDKIKGFYLEQKKIKKV